MTGGDRLDLSEEDGSCGDLTIGGKWENGAIGHADVDGTVDSAKGEGAEG